jgi:adhesin/invasin
MGKINIFALLLIIATNVGAGEAVNSVVDKSVDRAASNLNQSAENSTRNYLSNYFPTVEVQVDLINRESPSTGILVVVPLSSPNDLVNTFFNQSSIYHHDSRTTINIGLGYRRLVLGNKLLIGTNFFYDHEFPYHHKRYSAGLEMKTSVGQINYNQYFHGSSWKTGKSGVLERALSGSDLEIGMPIPYMNWATIFVKQFRWDAVDNVFDKKGNTLSLRAFLPTLPALEVEAGHTNHHRGKKDTNFLTITYNLIHQNKKQQWISNEAYELSDVSHLRYSKVRRENKIYKQKNNNGITTTGF